MKDIKLMLLGLGCLLLGNKMCVYENGTFLVYSGLILLFIGSIMLVLGYLDRGADRENTEAMTNEESPSQKDSKT